MCTCDRTVTYDANAMLKNSSADLETRFNWLLTKTITTYISIFLKLKSCHLAFIAVLYRKYKKYIIFFCNYYTEYFEVQNSQKNLSLIAMSNIAKEHFSKVLAFPPTADKD